MVYAHSTGGSYHRPFREIFLGGEYGSFVEKMILERSKRKLKKPSRVHTCVLSFPDLSALSVTYCVSVPYTPRSTAVLWVQKRSQSGIGQATSHYISDERLVNSDERTQGVARVSDQMFVEEMKRIGILTNSIACSFIDCTQGFCFKFCAFIPLSILAPLEWVPH